MPSRPPKTKANKLSGASSGTRNGRSLFAGSAGGLMGLGVGALALTGVSSVLTNLGLPSLTDMISNPLYLGAAGLGLFLLLK